MTRALAIAILLTLAGCQQEEKIVGYKPFFSGLGGQSSDFTLSGPGAELASTGQTPGAMGSITEEEAKSVATNPDGTPKLLIRNGRELMGHLRRLLGDVEHPEAAAALFYEQVLSPVTRAEFEQRGMGAREAFAMLKREERDLLRLFQRMPMGEHTPNAVTEKLGPNLQRVRLTKSAARGLKWSGFDMMLEEGRLIPVAAPLKEGAPTATVEPDLKRAVAAARTREEAEQIMREASANRTKYRWEPGQWRLRWFVPSD